MLQDVRAPALICEGGRWQRARTYLSPYFPVPFSLFPSTSPPVCRQLSPFCKASPFRRLTFSPSLCRYLSARGSFLLIFANNSKDIFSFRIKFVLLHLHLPLAAVMSSEGDGATGRSTTYWKSDTVRFVFGDLNVGTSNPNQRQMQR